MSAFNFDGNSTRVHKQATAAIKIDDVAAIGDWTLFRRRCAYLDSKTVTIDRDVAQALKRRFCLAYLGKRAQVAGGTYVTPGATVFTQNFVDRMAQQNAYERSVSYPWLAALVAQLVTDELNRTASRQRNLLGIGRERQPPHLHLVSGDPH